MALQNTLRLFAKWHVWLGWLVGLPIVMWLASGLFMVIKPIEEVRGEHLRLNQETAALVLDGSPLANEEAQLKELRVIMQDDRVVVVLTTLDETVSRVDFDTGEPIAPLSAEDARAIVAQRIIGGDKVTSVRFFEADEVPFDFRRPPPRLASRIGGRHQCLRRARHRRDRSGAHALVALVRFHVGSAHHGPV